jgi:sugar (pentulose or hexulose) kinase
MDLASGCQGDASGLCAREQDAAAASGRSIHDVLAAEIGEALARPSTLLFHPYLFGSPHGDVASGSFVGLRGWPDRGDMLRAVLEGIAMILRQLHEGRAEIEIAYSRGVMAQGNPTALAVIDEVFDTVDADWRGLGVIPESGYRVSEKYAEYDALRKFDPEVEPTQEPKGCRCGDVLRGAMSPKECPLFRKVCTPENPVGPCMVSGEGACAAAYHYGRKLL